VVIPSYTLSMKTAISVPNETYERASQRAGDLGISRSEFFTRAAQRYLDELDAQSLTRQVDDALNRLGAPDDTAAGAVVAGHRLLAEMDDEW
jgi:predicted DNA-binding protein